MLTLRDVWIAHGWTSVSLSAKCGITPATLYKLNRKGIEANGVAFGTVRCICRTLGITLEEFDQLDACPHAGQYRGT